MMQADAADMKPIIHVAIAQHSIGSVGMAHPGAKTTIVWHLRSFDK
jgi:hypothetical protein